MGAILNLKGYNTVRKKKVDESGRHRSKFELFYFDIPMLYQRNFKIKNKGFFAELGPYLGIGLNGKYKTRYYHHYEGEFNFEEHILFGKDKIDYLKPIDYGLLLNIGTYIKALQLGLSYVHGLRDISNPDIEKMRHRVVSIYAAYPLFVGKNE